MSKSSADRQWAIFVLLFFILFAGRDTSSINSLNKRATPRTAPPAGSLIVRQSSTRPGEFSTLAQAIDSLKGEKGPKTIFIYPGRYAGGVVVHYKHPLTILGYTPNQNTYFENKVTVTIARGASQAGGDAPSSAIWAKLNDFKMANINVENTFGTGTDTQAIALTAQGARQVYFMCSFSSYQDTLYVKAQTAYFHGCNIEGSVDFIFGRGTAWFERANIVVKQPRRYATITAHNGDGREQFVFNRGNIMGGRGTASGSAYLGRPWSFHAVVIFQFCSMSEVIKPAGWVAWDSPVDPGLRSVKFREYQNQGPGSQGTRSIGKHLTQPAKIEAVLGSDYQTWARL